MQSAVKEGASTSPGSEIELKIEGLSSGTAYDLWCVTDEATKTLSEKRIFTTENPTPAPTPAPTLATCTSETCVNGDCNDDKKCVCNEGYEGEKCDKSLDDACNSLTCVHGKCADDKKTCNCNDGFEGEKCDKVVKMKVACTSDTCLNGVCIEGNTKCKCDPGYEGQHCDRQICTNDLCNWNNVAPQGVCMYKKKHCG